MRWLVWSACLLALSVALLTPQPAHLAHDLIPSDEERFTVAKSGHLAAYALLAVLTAGLPVRRPLRWLLLLLLVSHACLTELLQQFVPSRSGRWQDALIDIAGLGLGVLLSWRWWRAP
jgi:VanZ family protein